MKSPFIRLAFSVLFVLVLIADCYSENISSENISSKNSLTACDVTLSFIKGNAEVEQSEGFDSNVLDQLKDLPFSSYRLLKKENKNVTLNQVAEFEYANDNGENKVAVTPIVIEGERIQTLIEWTSAMGDNILSSKMWFDNGKNLVFGAEHGNTRCTVLNIIVKCQK